jgi:dihydroflavonol-4-reductase
VNFVTGATGILGSHLMLKLIQRNEPVLALRQPTSEPEKVKKLFAFYSSHSEKLFAKIQWIDGDIRDLFSIEESIRQSVRVYHCAGFVSFNKRHRKKLFDINEHGTANVVNACLDAGKALCHVSSVATIHNLDYAGELNENVYWKRSGKESDYAISKYNGEREVWRGIEEGLDAVIVNPGVILSSGFWNQSSSRLFSESSKGNKFYSDGVAGYVAAEDVAEIMIQLMEKRLFGSRYIIIENNYTFKEVFTRIQNSFKKSAPIFKVGKELLYLAAFTEAVRCFISRKDPALTPSIISAALNKQRFSNAKIVDALGHKFLPVNEVIDRIAADFLSKKH